MFRLLFAVIATVAMTLSAQASITGTFGFSGDGDRDPPGFGDGNYSLAIATNTGPNITGWSYTLSDTRFQFQSGEVTAGTLTSINLPNHLSAAPPATSTLALSGGTSFSTGLSSGDADIWFEGTGGNFAQVLDGNTLDVFFSDATVLTTTFASGSGNLAVISGSGAAVPCPPAVLLLGLCGGCGGLFLRLRKRFAGTEPVKSESEDEAIADLATV